MRFFIVFFDRDGCLFCLLFSFLTHKKTPTNKKISTIIPIFIKLVSLAEGLPRTEVIESGRNYWRGVCRSLIFRFPDDLEILKLDVRSYVDRSKGIIQIRSAARLGQSDLGVNLRRVEYLFNQLEKF